MEILLAIPFGLLIGLVVGTVGGGGAILALPVLVYVLDQGVGPATTASLIVVALAASVGAGAQAWQGRVCWRVGLIFSIPAGAGAYAGTVASADVQPETLILAFVPVMLMAGALTYRRGDSPEEPEATRAECPKPSVARAGAAGSVVGLMTGFFGVGGGFLIVPALTILLGLPMRRAVATSLAIITLTGGAALASHLATGAQPNWPLTLVLCGSAAAGALGGTVLGRRLPVRTLAHGFGLVVVVVALFLLLDVLVFGGPPAG
jgi:uncharacterized membrane protein YfcA